MAPRALRTTGPTNARHPGRAGIGVRVEDDLAITADGAEPLSGAPPRTADSAEGRMTLGS